MDEALVNADGRFVGKRLWGFIGDSTGRIFDESQSISFSPEENEVETFLSLQHCKSFQEDEV